ncbi:unnamed protein product [Merluccius merluccius]
MSSRFLQAYMMSYGRYQKGTGIGFGSVISQFERLIKQWQRNMVHPRTEPPASHWIPGGKAAERPEEAEIKQQVAEHGTDTTANAR